MIILFPFFCFFFLKKSASSVLRVFLTCTFCVLAKRFVFEVKRPTKKTVEKWGFKALGYECNEEGEVTFVFCKTCREFYSDQRKHKVVGSSAFIKDQVDKYVTGTSAVKKNNFSEHLRRVRHT